MQRNQTGLALTLALLLGLGACQPQDVETGQTPAAATAGVTTTQAEPLAAPTEPDLISLEPASLPSCDAAVVVAKWDVRAKHPDITSIEIWVGSAVDNKVWIESTPFGEATTGPWTNPGAVFVLKNQATGKELARTVMQGPTCP